MFKNKKFKPIEVSIAFSLEQLEEMISKIHNEVSGFTNNSDYDSIEEGTKEIVVKYLVEQKHKDHYEAVPVPGGNYVKFQYTGTYYSEG